VAIPEPVRGASITDLVTRLLDRGYTQTVSPVLDAVTRSVSTGRIRRRLVELETEAARLADAGERLSANNPVLRAFLADLDDTLRADARLIDTAAEPLQASAVQAAGQIQRQLALPGFSDGQLRAIGVIWNQPDPEMVARLVQYAGSPAWETALEKFGPDVVAVVRNQAIRGAALGWGPIHSASEIARLATTFPRYQANNLMRTLQLTSYRDSTAAHQTANRAITSQVIRIAARDTRTCLSCIDQHGQVIWDAERDANSPVPRVDDHHSGRCGSFIVVTGRVVTLQPGAEWFASLSPERQQQQESFKKSPGKFAAYQSGRLGLHDFVQPYQDPTFGPMLREASLKGALSREPD